MFNNNHINVTNLGNIEQLLKMNDKTISLDKKSNLNPLINKLWVNVDNEVHYFKVTKNISYLLNDLLGVKITQFFGLPSVEYKLARGFYNDKEIFGLISKYQRDNEFEYESLEDTVYGENSLIENQFDVRNLSFLNVLEQTYSDQNLSKQVKTLIIRDLVTNEKERKMNQVCIRKKNKNTIIEMDRILDYEKEWNLSESEINALNELDIKETDIDLNYKIAGLLSLTKNDLSYIQSDHTIQENLNKFMDLDMTSLLEQVELETNLPVSQVDYDFYSIYSETVKQKLKKEKYLV